MCICILYTCVLHVRYMYVAPFLPSTVIDYPDIDFVLEGLKSFFINEYYMYIVCRDQQVKSRLHLQTISK